MGLLRTIAVSRFGATVGKKFLIVAGVLLAVFVMVNYVVLPLYVNHAGRVSVPAVVGTTREEAYRTLEGAGLRVVEAESRPDPNHPPGVVVQQIPPPQAIVKEGRHVYLTMSGGEVQVPVPSLRGRSLRDARFALERYGLTLGQVAYDTSDTYPENTIIYQSVAADGRVPKGSSISVRVSAGRAVSDARAPLVIGRTVSEAEKILASSGLRVGQITYQQSFDLLPNTVVDQYPRPGDPLGRGQAVDLFVVQVGRPAEEFQTPEQF